MDLNGSSYDCFLTHNSEIIEIFQTENQYLIELVVIEDNHETLVICNHSRTHDDNLPTFALKTPTLAIFFSRVFILASMGTRMVALY